MYKDKEMADFLEATKPLVPEVEATIVTLPYGQLKLKTVSRTQYMKRTKQLRLFLNRKAGKDAWAIYNEVKAQTGALFGKNIFVSPFEGYATLYCRL